MKKINTVLKLNLKSLKITSLMLLVGFTLFSFTLSAPPPPDPPIGHWTMGQMEPLAILLEDESERIRIINHTDCDINFDVFLTNNGIGNGGIYNIHLGPLGTTYVSNNHIAVALGITSGNLTNLSFNFHGAWTGHDMAVFGNLSYTTPWRRFPLPEDGPCDCVYIKVTPATPTTPLKIEIEPRGGRPCP